MYQFLKKVALAVFPREFLLRYESLFRKLIRPLYSGDQHFCNVCDEKLSAFVQSPTGDLCPLCGSLGRTRFLTYLIEQKITTENLSVLHFSPHRKLSNKLRPLFQSYQSSNYEDDQCDLQLDIQQTGLSEDRFDMIICFHVLEHIPDDKAAMRELYRILRKGGFCLIQVPFREGEMLEDPSVQDPKERLERFGQEDHLRWYNVESLLSRLNDAGFECSKIEASSDLSISELQEMAIGKEQIIIKASKSPI